MGSIYWGNLRLDRHQLIIRNTVYVSQLLIALTLAEPSEIHAICVVPLKAMYLFKSSHPFPTLIGPEPLILMNSLRMPCELRRFTTP